MKHTNQQQYTFPFAEFTSSDQLNPEEKALVERAMEASFKAYNPYSKFNVGAAVLLDNGKIITGNNQENAAYPSGLCAERVALFYASSQYPDAAVKMLAIVASKDGQVIKAPVPPCGSCRQVFIEWENRFKKPFIVIMAGTEKIIRVEKAEWLLPFNFQADFL
ncbi:cytidine deaminase [Thermophagus sp. OGC60D27]|uniref:cytidine deaminase n=1 Tax=Thermophagus sp. OGC60D27 TaxID=3458415 RepID=UPI0040380CB5